MRSLAICLGVLMAACSSNVSAPTPEQILQDGVVTAGEYRAAIRNVGSCVEAQGGQFESEFDRDGTPSFTTSGPAGIDDAVEGCFARHVGDVELVWADQLAPTPEEEASFYNEVVSCVEKELGVEFGTVEPRSGGGVDTSVTDSALAADRSVYMACFDEVARLP